MLVFGAVLSDRLPRNLVLVGASLVQASAQAATGTLVLSGHATVGTIAALQAAVRHRPGIRLARPRSG